MEQDASDWVTLAGGEDAYVQMYLQAARRAGLGPDKSLYIASGVFSYAGERELTWMNGTLAPFASQLLNKELFISKEELADLNTEQLALLDFLVLAQCQTFVGIGSSTFSVYLR